MRRSVILSLKVTLTIDDDVNIIFVEVSWRRRSVTSGQWKSVQWRRRL